MKKENVKKVKAGVIVLLLLMSLSQIFAANCGDVNNDNQVNIVDALLIAKAYVGQDNLTASVADVNSDSQVNIVDALLVAQYYVQAISKLNCKGEPVITPTKKPVIGTGNKLPREGNPAVEKYEKYKEFISKADNVLSFQLDCGGWPKNVSFDKKGKGGSGKGTFDNGATTMEITVMAAAYKKTGDKKYLNAARKGLDYIFKAQYSSGGWPQFYPLAGGYKNHVTFNDDAMSRVLVLLQMALEKQEPFNSDVFTEAQRSKLQKAIDGGVDYVLKSQVKQNGKLTVWCAQSGKDDYKPKKARAYEHPSLSGSESIEIIGFLMMIPQTPEVKKAAIAAIDWFRSPNTYLADYTYDKSKEGSNPFIPKKGSKVWYRFYDIKTNKPIFSNYDGKIHIGLENQGKKKSGYRWGGEWGHRIIDFADKVGY